jgi:hypothetical protein
MWNPWALYRLAKDHPASLDKSKAAYLIVYLPG